MNDPDRTGSGSALGDFLRSRRERLSPEVAGLTGGRRRRTPGLRREEVAARARIGIDWYVRLEQGRGARPSPATVDALAGALRLSPAEHAHLRVLAGVPETAGGRAAFARERVPDPVRRIVEALRQPAFVSGRRWDVLAWNAGAADLVADFGAMSEEDRNLLVYIFLDPDARRVWGAAWAGEAARVVAEFRVSCDVWAADPAFEALVRRLRAGSPEFARMWEAHDILPVGSNRHVLIHRVRGPLHIEYASFRADDDPALRLVIMRELDDAGE